MRAPRSDIRGASCQLDAFLCDQDGKKALDYLRPNVTANASQRCLRQFARPFRGIDTSRALAAQFDGDIHLGGGCTGGFPRVLDQRLEFRVRNNPGLHDPTFCGIEFLGGGGQVEIASCRQRQRGLEGQRSRRFPWEDGHHGRAGVRLRYGKVWAEKCYRQPERQK